MCVYGKYELDYHYVESWNLPNFADIRTSPGEKHRSSGTEIIPGLKSCPPPTSPDTPLHTQRHRPQNNLTYFSTLLCDEVGLCSIRGGGKAVKVEFRAFLWNARVGCFNSRALLFLLPLTVLGRTVGRRDPSLELPTTMEDRSQGLAICSTQKKYMYREGCSARYCTLAMDGRL